MRIFAEWVRSMRSSIATYDYYVDFEKVVENVERYRVELNILNALIGRKNDIEDYFDSLITEYPKTLKCIPLLLAVRSKEICVTENDEYFAFNFNKMNYSIEEYKMFMRKIGLFNMLKDHLVNNLVDYALGVETGLDSNCRKNRGGHLMESLVEKFIQKAGFIKDQSYFREMYASEIENTWNYDLSSLLNDDKTQKRFDFVLKTPKNVYAVETNFYTKGGSKLNETARSYTLLAKEARAIEGFTFVWITDGAWKTAKRNLEEAFDVLETLYNINDLENGIIQKRFI